jgi:hypothetical protein
MYIYGRVSSIRRNQSPKRRSVTALKTNTLDYLAVEVPPKTLLLTPLL